MMLVVVVEMMMMVMVMMMMKIESKTAMFVEDGIPFVYI